MSHYFEYFIVSLFNKILDMQESLMLKIRFINNKKENVKLFGN